MQLKPIKIPEITKYKVFKLPGVSRNDMAIAELEKGRHSLVCTIIPGKWQCLGDIVRTNGDKVPTSHWDPTIASNVPNQLVSADSLVDWAIKAGRDWGTYQLEFA